MAAKRDYVKAGRKTRKGCYWSRGACGAGCCGKLPRDVRAPEVSDWDEQEAA